MRFKYISAICSIFTAIGLNAMTASTDTVLHATGVDVLISENAEGLRIETSDSSSAATFTEVFPENATISSEQHFRKPFIGLWGNKHISWDVITANVLAGFVNAAGAPGEIDFEQGKSYEISVLNAAAIRCSINSTHSSISAGIGISWRNYRTTTGMQLTHGNDGSVGYEPFPSDVSPRYSRLKVFSLSFPILFTQKFRIPHARHLCLQFGPVLNWNSHASLSSRWINSDGSKGKFSTNDVAARRFSVDIYGALELFQGIGLYVRYSPQSVLRASPALGDFKSLSTGIVLAL